MIQVNLIEPTRDDIAHGNEAMTMGDYESAMQYFSKVIEV